MKSYPLPDDIQPLFAKLKSGEVYDLRNIHKRLLELGFDYDLSFLVVIFYCQKGYVLTIDNHLRLKKL